MTKLLALVDVRDMNFDDRRFEGVQRVEDCDRCVGKCSGIDHDAARGFSRLVDPVDDLVFTVRLVKAKFKSVLAGDLATVCLNIGKSFVPVDVRLPLAEKVEVRSIQYVGDAGHGWLRSAGWARFNGGRARGVD